MLWPSNLRVLVSQQPMDMRCGFERLSGAVRAAMGEDPTSGHLFLFYNKNANRIKILYWDKDGWALWYKRLERGTFAKNQPSEITATELQLLLAGIDLKQTTQRKRYIKNARF